MSRQSIGNGHWFDRAAARKYDESRTFNGQNLISDATGSQWNHEALYRTAKGRWVLHEWSRWSGSRESWTMVDDYEAMRWLVRNGHGEEIPKDALAALEV